MVAQGHNGIEAVNLVKDSLLIYFFLMCTCRALTVSAS